MTTTTIGIELKPWLEKMDEILGDVDPLRRQQILELSCAKHAYGMRNLKDSLFVADSINKHVKQLIEQAYREKDKWYAM